MKHENRERAAILRALREAGDVSHPRGPAAEVARGFRPFPWHPVGQPGHANENPRGDLRGGDAMAGGVGWERVPLPREARRQLAAGHLTRRIAAEEGAIHREKRRLARALAAGDEGAARTALARLATLHGAIVEVYGQLLSLGEAIAEGEDAAVGDGGVT